MHAAAAVLWHSESRLTALSAGGGVLAWAGFVALADPAPAAALFMLAPLVIVPLGLGLIEISHPEGRTRTYWRWVLRAQPFAAGLLLASFGLECGVNAAALAVPWFGFTLALAWIGLNLFRAGQLPFRAVALAYTAVGGFWAFLARAGVRPLGFPDVIVLATAVHFHYAGFLFSFVPAGRTNGGTSRYAAGRPDRMVHCGWRSRGGIGNHLQRFRSSLS
ncbi:MAG: YndJ family transporter [Planctomycetes bacterium]|nr:YndJ family transporter [Planctomycetota bacterium]